MAIVALIKRSGKEIPSLVERIQPGDEFCFVVNQKPLGWHTAQSKGRLNMLHYMGELYEAGGDPVVFPHYNDLGKIKRGEFDDLDATEKYHQKILEPL